MDPLLQLPGAKQDLVDRLENHLENDGIGTLRRLRLLPREQGVNKVKNACKGKVGFSIRALFDYLHSIPIVAVREATVSNGMGKVPLKDVGILRLVLEIRRESNQPKHSEPEKVISLGLLLGSLNSRMLLAHTSIQISRAGAWSVTKELQFDWNAAHTDSGDGFIVLRLMMEGVRGMDSELIVPLSNFENPNA